MFSLLFLPLLALATAAPTAEVAALKPYQLRGVQDPIFHLYLQPFPTDKTRPVMGPEASSEYYNLAATIQSLNSSMYLNILPAVGGKSYLPLQFSSNSSAAPWALEGDTVITAQTSTYGRQLNFLACATATSGYYDLYLQTGSDVPSGVTCSNYQTIHTPCLC